MMEFRKFVILGILLVVLMSGCTMLPDDKAMQKIPEVQVNSSGLAQSIQEQATPNQKLPQVQIINMSVAAKGYHPDTFVLQKGVKVRWIINVLNLTNCNKEIIVKDYGLDIKLKNGENVVEFTPDRNGIIRWSCWMNMIKGSFIIVDDPMNISEVENAMASMNLSRSTNTTGSMNVTGEMNMNGVDNAMSNKT